ncbi:MAG TPA: hypothetical protein VGP47_06925 [Parachlamydiaceae bacterium]|nr:hypothetical protein [Parachlamydiaceae bacterium]
MINVPLNAEKLALGHTADIKALVEAVKNKFKNIADDVAYGRYEYFLEKNSEEKLVKELKGFSPGVLTGFKIGEIDLKISRGAISIAFAHHTENDVSHKCHFGGFKS